MKAQIRLLLALGGGLAAAALPVLGWAVSSGEYAPSMQSCRPNADQFDVQGAQPGCYNSTVVVADGSGDRLLQLGTLQSAQNQPVGQAGYSLSPAGFDPATGAELYFGADDNLDLGEHDGARDWHNGPSDGGALAVIVTPAGLEGWAAALQAENRQYLLTHPAPVAAGGGGCADGTCASAQTQQTTVFQGGQSGTSRDAYDYSGVTWDPYGCASQDATSDSPQACGGHPLSWWNQQQGAVNAEPGVQVYEDPDAQGSPALPQPLYPVPAAYAGTCGVTAGGGALQAPASPLTNSAGQVQVKTGC